MSNNKNKLSLLIAALITSNFSYASVMDDTYLQANLGLNHLSVNSFHPDDRYHTSWRAAVGKYFTENLALELGYLNTPRQNWYRNYSNQFFSTKMDAFDIFAKLQIPMTDKFSWNAKVGGAFVHTHIDDYFNAFSNSHTLNLRPAAGLGASYNLTNNLSAELSWESIFGKSRDLTSPQINFASVGLKYQF